ncbi:MAG: RtcB family protein [Deltaproteobacteria bacterium]|nr:RtcB family protein [Deltaproteobacteria bacterium]
MTAPTAVIEQWLVEPPTPKVRRALAQIARGPDVARVAVMPDVHLSADVCVGVALATTSTLYPAAVGGDIGCGMAALAFDAPASRLAEARVAAQVLDGLYGAIPIMRHARRRGVGLPQPLADCELSTPSLRAVKSREAGLQFGTLGRGNHFLELQSDQDDRLWLMVHSGSRGMGQAIRQAHEHRGVRDRTGLRGLGAESDDGRAYLRDVQWALRYAAASRARMLAQATRVLARVLAIDANESSAIECHHNFVRRESHDGQTLWVHRKGALSAREDEVGIIPGSMGAVSHHVRGRGCAAALCSSSHGAGRAMARGVARRRISVDRLHEQMRGVWFDHRIAERLRDEAPSAYKEIGAVMRAQRALTRVERTLRPVLVFKGG